MKKNKVFTVMFCVGMLFSGLSLWSRAVRGSVSTSSVKAPITPEQITSEEAVPKTTQTFVSSTRAAPVVEVGQVSSAVAKPQGWLDWAKEKAAYPGEASFIYVMQVVKNRIYKRHLLDIENALWNSFNANDAFNGFDFISKLQDLRQIGSSVESFKNIVEKISVDLKLRGMWQNEGVVAYYLPNFFGSGKNVQYTPLAIVEKMQDLCSEKNYSALAVNFKKIIEDKMLLLLTSSSSCTKYDDLEKQRQCLEKIIGESKRMFCSDYSKGFLPRLLEQFRTIAENLSEVVGSDKHTVYDLKILPYEKFKSQYKDIFDIMEKVKVQLK